MSYRYAIIGTGRQGLAVAYDIGRHGDAEEIRLYDLSADIAQKGAERINQLLPGNLASGFPLDASHSGALESTLSGVHATISAVPFQLNPLICKIAVAKGSSFCDLGGAYGNCSRTIEAGPGGKKSRCHGNTRLRDGARTQHFTRCLFHVVH